MREPTPQRIGPFLVLGADDQIGDHATDAAILLQFKREEGELYVHMPQLDLLVRIPSAETAEAIFAQVLDRYLHLANFPQEKWTEVEEYQFKLLDTHFLPWITKVSGESESSRQLVAAAG